MILKLTTDSDSNSSNLIKVPLIRYLSAYPHNVVLYPLRSYESLWIYQEDTAMRVAEQQLFLMGFYQSDRFHIGLLR